MYQNNTNNISLEDNFVEFQNIVENLYEYQQDDILQACEYERRDFERSHPLESCDFAFGANAEGAFYWGNCSSYSF